MMICLVSFYAEVLFKGPWRDTDHYYAHLGRESRELVAGSGLSAGVDLIREQGWWPVGRGDRGVSGGSVSAAVPPSRNTSFEPTALAPAAPREAPVEMTTPGKLEEEPLPIATCSVTGEAGPRLSVGMSTTAVLPSPSRSSSGAFLSAFPSLSWHWGRPSSEILFRNNRAACLLLESFAFLRTSRWAFAGLLLLPVDCRPQKAVAILV